MSVPAILDRHPELVGMRAKERHMAWRSAVRGMLGLRENSAAPRPWLEYFAYRIRSRVAHVPLAGEVTPA